MTDVSWTGGHPRVVISDNWPANVGDMAIALALEELIRELAPDADVVHAMYLFEHPLPDLRGVRYVPPLEGLVGNRWREPEPDWDGPGVELLASCDLLISQGGGFFYEHYRQEGRIDALDRATSLAPACAVVGQSIGSFSGTVNRAAFGRIFDRAALIATRDEASYHHVVEMGAPTERSMVGSDLALSLFDEPPSRPPDPAAPVGFVASTFSAVDAGMSEEQASHVAEHVLGDILEHTDRNVLLFSSCHDHGVDYAEDDGELLRRLRSTSAASERVAIAPGGPSVADLRARCEGLSALVSMRFHPAMFGLGSGVPTALIHPGTKGNVLGAQGSRHCRDLTDSSARTAAVRAVLGDDAPTGREAWSSLDSGRAGLRAMTERLAHVLDRCS